jgi:hypothetical protein
MAITDDTPIVLEDRNWQLISLTGTAMTIYQNQNGIFRKVFYSATPANAGDSDVMSVKGNLVNHDVYVRTDEIPCTIYVRKD